jgi:superfamily II DNA or RNA helicase
MLLHPVAPRAYREGLVYVPYRDIGTSSDLDRLKRDLVYVGRGFRGSEPPVIQLYDVSRAGFIGLPRAFAERRFGSILEIEDRTSLGARIEGVTRLPDPNHPSVQEPAKQAKFMEDLYQGLLTHETFLAEAPTGTGKTVCFLHASARLGYRTLVLVHLTRLMRQWQEQIADMLGVPEDRIGTAQSRRSDWEGKDYVVGMLHSVVQNEYPAEFYRAFGLVGFDEVHKLGCEFFAPAVSAFSARYRVGLSATMERKGAERVFFWHLGPVRVKSTASALPCTVYVQHYRDGLKIGDDRDTLVRIAGYARDRRRNRMLASIIAHMAREGRNLLVVSYSVEHLQLLMKIAHETYGVSYKLMGRYFGEVHIETRTVIDDFGQRIKKKVRKRRTDRELELVKEKAQIIFAPYGMITEGVDIPRLDAGLDATPQGKATQLIGRIRRPAPDKPRPKWVTILDDDCEVGRRLYEGRLKDYMSTGATVIDQGG